MTHAPPCSTIRGPHGRVRAPAAAPCARWRRRSSASPRARRSASSASRGSGKSVTSYAVMRILDRAGAHRRGHASASPASTSRTAAESAMRDLRGREMSMIFQNPRAALNPIRQVGRQIEDVLLRARPGDARATRKRQGDRRCCEQVRIPTRGALPRLSVRAVGRHVPARRDRDRARLPAAAADRRRADHRPRRDDAEGGDGPGRRADRATRHVDDPDHPRPRPRRAILRPHRRHAEGPRRRDGAGRRRIFRAPAASLHARS